MSYILDALRKADAQRERDPARGINAQSAPLGGGSTRRSNAPLLWGAIAMGLAVVAVASWYLLRDKPAAPVAIAPAPPVATVAAPAPPPAAMAQQPAPAVQTAPMAPIVGVPPAGRTISPRDPTNTSQPTMRGAQQVPGMIPEVPPSARAADAREAAMTSSFGRRGAQPQQAPQPAAGTPPGMAPAAAAAAATPPATGLPPDAPQLAISGGVYSTNAAQRMLIVNGQVFNEGSELAPGLTLERVTPKGAVVKFRGASYTVAY